MEPKKIDIVYGDVSTNDVITPDEGMFQAYTPEYLHKYLSGLNDFTIEFKTLKEKLLIEQYLNHIGIISQHNNMTSGLIIIKEKSLFKYQSLYEQKYLGECFYACEIIKMMEKLKL